MQIKKGQIIGGKITGITKYGAFVNIDGETPGISGTSGMSGMSGMIHISEIADGYVKDINEILEINQEIKAVVIGVNESGKLALSIKQMPKNNKNKNNAAPPENINNFEDMMSRFKKESDEKISGLKSVENKPKRSRGDPRGRPRK